MIGSGLTSLPWAYSQSGLGLGVLISLALFSIGFYTGYLIVLVAHEDDDYADTVYKYFGKKGWVITMVGSIGFIYAAGNIYFELMSQSLYPILEAVLQWTTGAEYEIDLSFKFNTFSLPYAGIILAVILFIMVSFGNINFFIKINTFGTIFIVFSMGFIIYYGLISFTDTTFKFGNAVAISMNESKIDLFKTNFASLAGMSTLGFGLHNVSLPILKNNKDKKNNVRDLFLGYLLTFICYVIVGGLGYIGFSGTSFKDSGGISNTENGLNLFPPKHVFAFIARIALFGQIILVFPLLYHIMSIQISYLLFKTDTMPKSTKLIVNLVLIGFNTILGAGYPQVGSVIGLLGSVLGLNTIYIIPIAVYLKRYKLELSNPKLVEALDFNRIKTVHTSKHTKSPKIGVFEDTESEDIEVDSQSGRQANDVTLIKDRIHRLQEKLALRRAKQNRFRNSSKKHPSFTPLSCRVQQTPLSMANSEMNEGLISGYHKGEKPDFETFYMVCFFNGLIIGFALGVCLLQFIKI